MSRMLSKMNLISVVQQLPKDDIETIQGYVEMIEQENDVQKAMIENFVKENQELKEQLEEHKIQYFKDTGIQSDKILELKNQQKEFIEWLENYLKLFDDKDTYEEGYYDCIEEILSKFKEIIGDDK